MTYNDSVDDNQSFAFFVTLFSLTPSQFVSYSLFHML